MKTLWIKQNPIGDNGKYCSEKADSKDQGEIGKSVLSEQETKDEPQDEIPRESQQHKRQLQFLWNSNQREAKIVANQRKECNERI